MDNVPGVAGSVVPPILCEFCLSEALKLARLGIEGWYLAVI